MYFILHALSLTHPQFVYFKTLPIITKLSSHWLYTKIFRSCPSVFRMVRIKSTNAPIFMPQRFSITDPCADASPIVTYLWKQPENQNLVNRKDSMAERTFQGSGISSRRIDHRFQTLRAVHMPTRKDRAGKCDFGHADHTGQIGFLNEKRRGAANEKKLTNLHATSIKKKIQEWIIRKSCEVFLARLCFFIEKNWDIALFDLSNRRLKTSLRPTRRTADRNARAALNEFLVVHQIGVLRLPKRVNRNILALQLGDESLKQF